MLRFCYILCKSTLLDYFYNLINTKSKKHCLKFILIVTMTNICLSLINTNLITILYDLMKYVWYALNNCVEMWQTNRKVLSSLLFITAVFLQYKIYNNRPQPVWQPLDIQAVFYWNSVLSTQNFWESVNKMIFKKITKRFFFRKPMKKKLMLFFFQLLNITLFIYGISYKRNVSLIYVNR